MKIFVSSISLVCASSIFLLACGGGGGGGSSSSGSNSESVLEGDTRSSRTGVRLLNGALDASPVDLRSDQKEEPLTTSRFSLPAGFAAVSTNPQTITVVPTKNLSPTIFSQVIDLESSERVTILIYGNNLSLGLRTALLPDTRPAELEGAAIRIIHADSGASSLAATVDGVSVAAGVGFGSASAYSEVAAGPHGVVVTRATDGLQLFSGSVELESGKSYSLFVTGQAGYLSVARLLED